MAVIEIKVAKSGNDIMITNSLGKEIKILDINKQIKATDIATFLSYTKDITYELEDIEESLKEDKNVNYVHLIFSEIIEKINQNESECLEDN